MDHIKSFGLAAIAGWVVIALAGTSIASATTLEVKGVTQTGAVTIKASLEAGTSSLLKDDFSNVTTTCSGSTIEGKTTTFTGPAVSLPVSSLTFTGCSHTTDVLASGSLSGSRIGTTTNGTVTSSGTEVLVRSTFFGINAVCRTGAGTDIGTLTGKASGQATLDINATLDCDALGNGYWTASYVVTSPEGLGFVG